MIVIQKLLNFMFLFSLVVILNCGGSDSGMNIDETLFENVADNPGGTYLKSRTLTKYWYDDLKKTAHYVYDAYGNVIWESVDENGNGEIDYEFEYGYEYDSLGQVQSYAFRGTEGSQEYEGTIVFEHEYDGSELKTTKWYSADNSSSYFLIVYSYTENGDGTVFVTADYEDHIQYQEGYTYSGSIPVQSVVTYDTAGNLLETYNLSYDTSKDYVHESATYDDSGNVEITTLSYSEAISGERDYEYFHYFYYLTDEYGVVTHQFQLDFHDEEDYADGDTNYYYDHYIYLYENQYSTGEATAYSDNDNDYLPEGLDCDDARTDILYPRIVPYDCDDCPGAYLTCIFYDYDGDSYSEYAGDCNDDDASIYPAYGHMLDECDEIDNDCDGEIDEDCTDLVTEDVVEDDDVNESYVTYYQDSDGDGWGNQSESIQVYIGEEVPEGYVDNWLDCNDDDSSIHPDRKDCAEFELLHRTLGGDEIDNDCDGEIDEDECGFKLPGRGKVFLTK